MSFAFYEWYLLCFWATLFFYFFRKATLLEIYKYEHYKVFEEINTYTYITLLSKTPKTNNMFVCYRNTSDTDLKIVQTMENQSGQKEVERSGEAVETPSGTPCLERGF